MAFGESTHSRGGMDRKTLCVPMSIMMILFLTTVQPYAFGESKTFRGKLVDFDTRKPIDGAVVVAIWFNLEDKPSIKELKESLTDKNGEWSIVGQGGGRERLHPLPHPMLEGLPMFPWPNEPTFMIFKPGYEDFEELAQGSYSFLAYPHVGRRHGLEGIILSISQKEERYVRSLLEKSQSELPKPYGPPFISMNDPERRLRNLEIPFDYPQDVKRLYVDVTDRRVSDALDFWMNLTSNGQNSNSRRETLSKEELKLLSNLFHFTGFLNNYTLFGLKRLKDRESRVQVLERVTPIDLYPNDPVQNREFLKKQKNWLRLYEEECKNLGTEDYKHYWKLLEY